MPPSKSCLLVTLLTSKACGLESSEPFFLGAGFDQRTNDRGAWDGASVWANGGFKNHPGVYFFLCRCLQLSSFLSDPPAAK